jgi:hypothetical protein
MIFRASNVVLGVWLFVSAFLWRHSAQQLSNTWILGVLCVAFALVALAAPPARYLNTALAVWLFVSAFALPSVTRTTVVNNALVAAAMFALSLLPLERGRALRRRAEQPA